MKINHQIQDRITVVNLEGDITLDELDPLRKVVADQLACSNYDFVIDLSQVEFVDSKGLETLLWLQEQAADRLGQVRLVNPSSPVRQILRLTRLDRAFESHPTVENALKSLR